MAGILLDGEAVASRVRSEVAARVQRLSSAGRVPGLGTILVGDDPPSARYVAMKHADCAQVGMASYHEHLPQDASQRQVLEAIARFNENPLVDAYLLQLPLPKGLDEQEALMAIDPDKDVDGLHPVNLGRLVQQVGGGEDGKRCVVPCTPGGIVELLRSYRVPVEGHHVVIVGRGLTIGRPLSLLLSSKRPGCNAAVTIVHTGVEDLGSYVVQGDVVVAAAGVAGLIKPEMVKPGAALVGAGISWEGRRLLSDLAEGVEEVAGWYTPRVGGVGPMTRAMLLVNAVEAAERHLGVR